MIKHISGGSNGEPSVYELTVQVRSDAPIDGEIYDMLIDTLALTGAQEDDLAMRIQAVIDDYLASETPEDAKPCPSITEGAKVRQT